jgi:hypothetical protein
MMQENISEESENEVNSVDCTLVLLFIISGVLLLIDSIEIYKFIQNFQILKGNVLLFETCFKWEILTKAVFAFFSFCAAFSAMILTLGLLINVEFFINKLLDTFLYFNFLIFGPFMLTFSVLALIYIDNTIFTCDKSGGNIKLISFTNIISIIACGSISLIITICKSIYSVVLLFNDSILRREGGNFILAKIFWWFVLRHRDDGNNNNNLNNNTV